jgi:hypothetical protein
MELKIQSVNVLKDDIIYCKSKGISLTKILRQAIHKHRKDEFKYEFM